MFSSVFDHMMVSEVQVNPDSVQVLLTGAAPGAALSPPPIRVRVTSVLGSGVRQRRLLTGVRVLPRRRDTRDASGAVRDAAKRKEALNTEAEHPESNKNG